MAAPALPRPGLETTTRRVVLPGGRPTLWTDTLGFLEALAPFLEELR